MYGALAPTRAAVALTLLASAAARRSLSALFASAAGPGHPEVLHAALAARLSDEWVTTGLPGPPGDVAPARGASAAVLGRGSLAARAVGDAPRPIEALLSSLPYGTRLLTLARGDGGRVLYAGVLLRLPSGCAWPPGEPLRARARAPLRSLDLASVGAAHAAAGAAGLAGAVFPLELDFERAEALGAVLRAAGALDETLSPRVRAASAAGGLGADLQAAAEGAEVGALPPAVAPAGPDSADEALAHLLSSLSAVVEPLLGAGAPLAAWLGDAGEAGKSPLILCVERDLAAAPWEALPLFAGRRGALARDVSPALLGVRLAVSEALLARGGGAPAPPQSPTDGAPWFARPPLEPCHALATGDACAFLVDPRGEDDGGGGGAPGARRTLQEGMEVLTGGVAGAAAAAAAAAAEAAAAAAPQAKGGKAPAPAAAAGKAPSRPASASAPPAPPAPPPPRGLLEALGLPTSTAGSGDSALGGGWRGLRDPTARVPSGEEVQTLLRRTPLRAGAGPGGAPAGGAFAALCHGRVLAGPGAEAGAHGVLPPARIAGLLCPAVRVALLAEGVAATGGAYRAALLRAADATHAALPAANAWDAAALLAMAGVGSSVSHAWPVSHAAAEALLHGTFARSAGGVTPVAEAVRSVFLPRDEAAAVAAAAAAAAEHAAAAAAAAAAGGKAGAKGGKPAAELPPPPPPPPPPGPRPTPLTVKPRVAHAAVVWGLPHARLLLPAPAAHP